MVLRLTIFRESDRPIVEVLVINHTRRSRVMMHHAVCGVRFSWIHTSAGLGDGTPTHFGSREGALSSLWYVDLRLGAFWHVFITLRIQAHPAPQLVEAVLEGAMCKSTSVIVVLCRA